MPWFDVALKVSALIGGALALVTFWRSAQVRRAEWLSNLHAKFFEAPSYKTIRRILDNDDPDPDLHRLRDELAADKNSDLVEDFVDYLNFFELVGSLRKLHQVRAREISMLFEYYLSLLCRHDFVRSYIRKQGFEQLEALLEQCVDKKK